MAKKIKAPNQETVAGKNYLYLDLPRDMDNCSYDLEFKEFKLTDNEDKYVAVFEVIDTDTKIKKGADISHMMDPFQKYADTYFWRDIFTIYLTTRGKEATEARIKKLAAKYDNPAACMEFLQNMVDNEFGCIGGTCNCSIRSYEKDDKRKTAREWTPLSVDSE